MSKAMQRIGGGLLVLLLAVGAVIVTHNAVTSQLVTTSDFLPRWEGARLFFGEGQSPYSPETSLSIQEKFYGRAAGPEDDQVLFAYPFYTVFVVGPTTLFNYAWGSAIWMVLLTGCVLGIMVLLLRLYNWRPAAWLVPLLFLWALMDYFAVRGVFLGQPSHVVAFLQVLAIVTVVRGSDEVAGVALAFSTIKPQMGYLFVPLLLLWGLRARRWRLLAAFGAAFGGLMAASFLLEPGWFGEWLTQVRLYSAYTAIAYPDDGSPVWIVTRYYLGLGPAVEWAVTIVLLAPVLWGWYTLLVEGREERWLWVVMMTLLISHLIALRTATAHFVVFNVGLVFYIKRVAVTRGGGWAAAAVIGLWLLNWGQFLATSLDRLPGEDSSIFLTLSFGVYALTLLTRRIWWQHAPTPSESPAAAPRQAAG